MNHAKGNLENSSLAPDRIRSFLEQLGEYCHDYSWHATNLYSLSESLAQRDEQTSIDLSGTLQVHKIPFRLNLFFEADKTCLCFYIQKKTTIQEDFILMLLIELLNLAVKMIPTDLTWIESENPLEIQKNILPKNPEILWIKNSKSFHIFSPEGKMEVVNEMNGGQLFIAKELQKLLSEKIKDTNQEVSIFDQLDILQKCEVLRWFLVDYETSNPNINRTIAKALKHPHWEVNITAMLIAVRFGRNELAPIVKQLNLPKNSRSGLNSQERSILIGMKKAALYLLDGGVVPTTDPGDFSSQAQRFDHLVQCVSGKNIQQYETVFLLSLALTSPSIETPAPDESVLGQFIISGRKIYLRESGIEMIHVPPESYWLGYDQSDLFPTREKILERGFLISRFPVFKETLIKSETRDFHPLDYYQADSYAVFSFEEAKGYCQKLSLEENMDISIPSNEEWEMTSRGQNGQFYPWGSSYYDGMLQQISPVDAKVMAGVIPQWVISTRNEKPLCMGGLGKYARTYQGKDSENEQVALRFVIQL